MSDLVAKFGVVAGWVALLWLIEMTAPFYAQFPRRIGDKLRHDAINLTFAGLSAVAAAAVGGGLLWIDGWAETRAIGLARLFDGPAWLELGLVLVAFDGWMYIWHRATHTVPFLWRFHRAHHSDPDMDVSTGVRFHPGEIVLSGCARLVVLPLLGMGIAALLTYETLLLPVVLFHHSNVRLPRALDYGLLAMIVTPAMHRVHHSRERHECDSNYGSILPWWDRLLGTFRLRDDARTVRLGLTGLDSASWQSLPGLLLTPFRR